MTLDRRATETVTVDWATSDGTAEAGTDYTAGRGSLTFSAGEDGKTPGVAARRCAGRVGSLTFSAGEDGKTVSVSVTGDTVAEPSETFTVTLSNESGATIGDGAATGTIMDDDGPPAVTLVLTPASIGEAGGVSTVTATLDRPSSAATTVTVSVSPVPPATTSDYTASPADFTAEPITIMAGETGAPPG